MPPHDPPEARTLSEARDETIEQLSSAFAEDEIGLDEFERRVDAAYAATDDARLQSLVRGLEHGTAPLVRVHTGEMSAPRPAAGALAKTAPRQANALAVLGSLQRSGPGKLADGTRAVAVFGNVELDLRDVVLEPGVTDLVCRAVFGNIEITVPPDLAVECVGAGVLGSFSSVHRIPPEGGEGRVVLRIVGAAVFGNVEVHTLPRAMSPMKEAQGRGGPKRLPVGK